jgi:hypothetical protein
VFSELNSENRAPYCLFLWSKIRSGKWKLGISYLHDWKSIQKKRLGNRTLAFLIICQIPVKLPLVNGEAIGISLQFCDACQILHDMLSKGIAENGILHQIFL